jgi:hypothetical protein
MRQQLVLQELAIGGRIIWAIKINFKEAVYEECGLDSSGLGWDPLARSCEHDDESSGSTKGGEFLDKRDHLNDCRLLLTGCVNLKAYQ